MSLNLQRYLIGGFLAAASGFNLYCWEHRHHAVYAFFGILAASIAMPILIEVAREKL
jgi:hypothetical protein